MHSVRKLVYYCEFCRKYKLTPQSMKLHEKHCTLNPDRICRMPGCIPLLEPCPWCQFAKVRQAGDEWDRDVQAEAKEWLEQTRRDYTETYS